MTGERGFTLIELLVGLALLGAMVVVMAGAYEAVIGTRTRIEARDGAEYQLQAGQELLRGRLAAAYPGFVGDDPKTIAFTGTATRVEFIAPLPDRFGAPALVWYTGRLAPDGTLHLSWRLDRGAEQDTVVMTGLSHGFFAYYGTRGEAGDAGWSERWEGRTVMPDLVRLHVERGDGQGRDWPDLLVAPLVTASIECKFDPADGRCRER